jgi:segregation and condensation protein B
MIPDEHPSSKPWASWDDDSSGQVIMSAEKLSQAFAQLMCQPASAQQPTTPAAPAENAPTVTEGETAVSPLSVLEAMLFVGHPQNRPLSNRQLAGLMRGVSPAEVDSLVSELNDRYDQERTAYTIVAEEGGYRMVLRDEFAAQRQGLRGKVREARLSQSSIELLAIVAYNQPIERQEIERIRGKPSAAALNQLVRRELLSIERTKERPRRTLYRTTDRFLALFHLNDLDDLPRPEDF